MLTAMQLQEDKRIIEFLSRQSRHYSEVLNKSTGTIQKSHPKILRYSILFAVLLKLIQKFGLRYSYFGLI